HVQRLVFLIPPHQYSLEWGVLQTLDLPTLGDVVASSERVHLMSIFLRHVVVRVRDEPVVDQGDMLVLERVGVIVAHTATGGGTVVTYSQPSPIQATTDDAVVAVTAEKLRSPQGALVHGGLHVVLAAVHNQDTRPVRTTLGVVPQQLMEHRTHRLS